MPACCGSCARAPALTVRAPTWAPTQWPLDSQGWSPAPRDIVDAAPVPVDAPRTRGARAGAVEFDVNCEGKKIGVLSFPIYEEWKVGKGQKTKLGCRIEGGFRTDKGKVHPYPDDPCCCDELRWLQVITTNSNLIPDMPSGTYVDPRWDYHVPDDNEPFYWHTRITQEARGTGPAVGPKRLIEKHRRVSIYKLTDPHMGRVIGQYELHFEDIPSRPRVDVERAQKTLDWSAELCLVCVARKAKEIQRLKCVTYGFLIKPPAKGAGRAALELRPPRIRDAGTGTKAGAQAISKYGGGWQLGHVTGPRGTPTPPAKGR